MNFAIRFFFVVVSVPRTVASRRRDLEHRKKNISFLVFLCFPTLLTTLLLAVLFISPNPVAQKRTCQIIEIVRNDCEKVFFIGTEASPIGETINISIF